MGFNSVYQFLKELFPQVDTRILKAVAIEHSKDPNGAVESIFTEVLPFISNQSNIPSSAVENNGRTVESTSLSSSMPVSIEGKDANASDKLNHELNITSMCMSDTLDDSLASSFYDAKDTDDHLSTNTKNETEISIGHCEGKKIDFPSVSFTSECSEDNFNHPFGNHVGEAFVPSPEFQDIRVNKIGNALSFSNDVDDNEVDANLSSDQIGHLNHFNCHSSYNCNFKECRASTEQASSFVKDDILDALHNDTHLLDSVNKELCCYIDDFIQKSPMLDEVGKDNPVLSTIVTCSGQICEINLLQDIVEDAKNYKATLLSAMESVTTMMKEVELREKEARDAKEAATRGGLEILEKVEELKRMLKHAKEANDMHAGEVYGEKSILATEVKELQTRLLGLSDEKDKSLSILEEMQETLEARLIVAEEERRAAEHELLEKEENARGALAEQELIMEKVVQESKALQLEAEENAKLHDFLMDKGRLLDVLQGEISVVCQDVKSLKENLDKRVSFSNSLYFQQTSCHRASSSSSVKSMASDVAPGLTGLPESPSRISRATSVDCQTPKSIVGEGDVKAAARKELLDEDWELFDF